MTRIGACVLVLATTGCDLYFDRHEPESTRPDAATSSTDATDAPPGTLPILHYRFDDTLANDGTLGRAFDGAGTAYAFVAGRRGNAVAFDTTRDTAVVLPTQVPLSSGVRYTVGLWFREDAVWNSGGYTQYLFDSRGSGGFQTYHGYAGNEALTTCSAAGCMAFGYSVGTWHHLIYRYDGDAGAAPLEIFIDGVRVVALPASTVYFSATQKNIVIGTRTNMQVDELKVFGAVFDVAEQCARVVGGSWMNGACRLD
jgi:hypothetical protein